MGVGWSLCAAKQNGEDMWEIRNIKASSLVWIRWWTWITISWTSLQSTLIRPLVKAKLFITILAMHAANAQNTGSRSCTYIKAWLAEQKAIADLLMIGWRRKVCYPNTSMFYQEKPDTFSGVAFRRCSLCQHQSSPPLWAFRVVVAWTASTTLTCIENFRGRCWCRQRLT